MTTFNEQFQRYLDLQKEAFEPMRAFGGVAADTFERFARQNYALLGDYVEYAVGQAKLPGEVKDYNDYVAKQIAFNRDFSEKLAKRVQEYVNITRESQAVVQEVATAEVSKAEAQVKKARAA